MAVGWGSLKDSKKDTTMAQGLGTVSAAGSEVKLAAVMAFVLAKH